MLYEEEFGRKLCYCLYYYVLSDNKINGKSLINEEVFKITECFLGHFYNIEDMFLKNI